MNQLELIARLKPETAKIDAAMRQDLASIDSPRLKEVLEYAIFNGGKRIRPLLLILAARLCAPQADDGPGSGLYRLALAYEYIHAASLLHDDVIDHAESRRGRATANRVWDNTHVILAGDFLHSRAMWLAGSLGGVDCLAALSRATAGMVEAEFLQLANAEEMSRSRERYFAALTGKTGLLIAAACESGAIFAGAGDELRRALAVFGNNLGLTFQIVDDLLDYLGDEGKTGKAVGNDFKEGKMTLPLLLALETATAPDRARLLKWLAAGSAEERRLALPEAREIIDRAGGFTTARRQAEALTKDALDALAPFAGRPELSTLKALTAYVLKRDK